MDLMSALNWRYAVKKFDGEKKIPQHIFNQIEDSLMLAPSSYGLQPWKFVIVTDQKTKESLVKCSYGQKQIAECSHLIVLTSLKSMNTSHVKKFIQQTETLRKTPAGALKAYEDLIIGDVSRRTPEAIQIWNQKQAYIALGFALTTAAYLGVDTCPMEGIVGPLYDEILDLTESDYSTSLALPCGYRADEDKNQFSRKSRFLKEELFKRI